MVVTRTVTNNANTKLVRKTQLSSRGRDDIADFMVMIAASYTVN